jgi:hypothetical protein
MVAFHEAGHAVMGILLGRTITFVEGKDGSCQFDEHGVSADVQGWNTDGLAIAIAGPLAEHLHGGEAFVFPGSIWDEGGRQDYVYARIALSASFAHRDERTTLQRAEQYTRDLLARPDVWRAIEAVAVALELATCISGSWARALVHQHVEAPNRVGLRADFLRAITL